MNTRELLAIHGPRETMDYDVVVGRRRPAGLAAAIRLKQLCAGRERRRARKGLGPARTSLSAR